MSLEIQNANTIYDYTRPSQSFSEQIVSAQLIANSSVEAANRRPPIPRIGKIAPRFGYRSEPANIDEVLNVDQNWPARFGDWSGSLGGYQGTSYPSTQSTYYG